MYLIELSLISPPEDLSKNIDAAAEYAKYDKTKEEAKVVAGDAKKYEEAQKKGPKEANKMAQKSIKDVGKFNKQLSKENGYLDYKLISGGTFLVGDTLLKLGNGKVDENTANAFLNLANMMLKTANITNKTLGKTLGKGKGKGKGKN